MPVRQPRSSAGSWQHQEPTAALITAIPVNIALNLRTWIECLFIGPAFLKVFSLGAPADVLSFTCDTVAVAVELATVARLSRVNRRCTSRAAVRIVDRATIGRGLPPSFAWTIAGSSPTRRLKMAAGISRIVRFLLLPTDTQIEVLVFALSKPGLDNLLLRAYSARRPSPFRS